MRNMRAVKKNTNERVDLILRSIISILGLVTAIISLVFSCHNSSQIKEVKATYDFQIKLMQEQIDGYDSTLALYKVLIHNQRKIDSDSIIQLSNTQQQQSGATNSSAPAIYYNEKPNLISYANESMESIAQLLIIDIMSNCKKSYLKSDSSDTGEKTEVLIPIQYYLIIDGFYDQNGNPVSNNIDLIYYLTEILKTNLIDEQFKLINKVSPSFRNILRIKGFISDSQNGYQKLYIVVTLGVNIISSRSAIIKM